MIARDIGILRIQQEIQLMILAQVMFGQMKALLNKNDYSVDLLSDGFDLYATSGNLNSTNKYLYAWAEAPSVNLFGGRC